MQLTTVAIAVLSVLDMGILVLIPLLDKRLYGNYPKLPKTKDFFSNTGYEGRVYRFVYSSGGFLLISAVFLAVVLLSKQYGHGESW